MSGNKIKAVHVPVLERTYINGYAELMGYLGVSSQTTLKKNYIDKPDGIRVIRTSGVNRFKRSEVDKWIEDHAEKDWQPPARLAKAVEANKQ